MAEAKAPVDIYDEEFYNNLKLAKILIDQLGRNGDKQICRKWIGKLISMETIDPVVKKNRNSFFKYMLQILRKAVKDSAYKMGFENANQQLADDHYMCKWSKDKRTYIATKPLPGQGALVYMAVARDPSLGWDHPSI
ncbi:hypothetical protein GWI33_015434 [Rhynchophorus ferrugineus]|uniref:DUF4485 domain-containing protein n=1 Tax=Rhynchophorus ferrugineus TaxID=354439 RepID=A0A834M9R6_RHYFE|nr:hypothetical protein GWI33_015434 [Rhynchophorus ferrugineus]